MNSLVILAAINLCMDFKFISESPRTKKDDRVINRASIVCRKEYNGCLKEVVKKKEDTYWVICRED